MSDIYEGKNAVITGAACGIGKALAMACVARGMKVVLADVDAVRLNQVRKEIPLGVVYVFPTDVSKSEDVEMLAKYSQEKLGNIHYLFNNAGVSMGGAIWEFTKEDWQWVFGVNLWGVIHGVMHFVPKMIEHGEACYVINTASVSGFTCPPEIGVYNVSKHGVVAISETLQNEASEKGHNIKVAVLCPDFVSTEIMTSKRNRPAELKSKVNKELSEEERRKWAKAVEEGMKPSEVADITFSALERDDFYIFTHKESMESIADRVERILTNRRPVSSLNNKWEQDADDNKPA